MSDSVSTPKLEDDPRLFDVSSAISWALDELEEALQESELEPQLVELLDAFGVMASGCQLAPDQVFTIVAAAAKPDRVNRRGRLATLAHRRSRIEGLRTKLFNDSAVTGPRVDHLTDALVALVHILKEATGDQLRSAVTDWTQKVHSRRLMPTPAQASGLVALIRVPGLVPLAQN